MLLVPFSDEPSQGLARLRSLLASNMPLATFPPISGQVSSGSDCVGALLLLSVILTRKFQLSAYFAARGYEVVRLQIFNAQTKRLKHPSLADVDQYDLPSEGNERSNSHAQPKHVSCFSTIAAAASAAANQNTTFDFAPPPLLPMTADPFGRFR
ncbi:hypothetical protein JCGZ_02883 [Jatropha curcas]|uniref:Uncharacterized protein n=1 Tax=Jatropha curcas TaxID=180498 RepID=A0A067JGQ7_JATCU|nr:hypothetical protein JCGZ_02883 [Jatropha curcas]